MARTTAGDTTRLWECLSHAHNLMISALEKDFVPQAGMPLAWFEVLHRLSVAPDGLLRYQDVARDLGISDSGASRRLDQMTRAGLIDRQSCPTDRRGVYAHITGKGRESFKRANAVFVRSLKKNQDLLQGLSHQG